jgi:hypothetical protein
MIVHHSRAVVPEDTGLHILLYHTDSRLAPFSSANGSGLNTRQDTLFFYHPFSCAKQVAITLSSQSVVVPWPLTHCWDAAGYCPDSVLLSPTLQCLGIGDCVDLAPLPCIGRRRMSNTVLLSLHTQLRYAALISRSTGLLKSCAGAPQSRPLIIQGCDFNSSPPLFPQSRVRPDFCQKNDLPATAFDPGIVISSAIFLTRRCCFLLTSRSVRRRIATCPVIGRHALPGRYRTVQPKLA